ncbi:MAG: RIP metalloprotease RseP [Pseudomonadota bacterium]
MFDPLIDLVTTIVPFLLVLGIVIFVHEYGHYIVGRWSGIHAEEFALGFGGEIVGWVDKRGTRWKICWLPLGGYVRFKGDADAASKPDPSAVEGMSAAERRSTLPGAPLWARAATVAAGPMANFLLSILVFAMIALALGRASDQPVLAEVRADGQAAGAGLQVGDRIVSVDGEPVESFSGFLQKMFAREGEPLPVSIVRDGDQTTLPVAFSRPARIATVQPDTAAYGCLAPGDVIARIDGEPITSFIDLQKAVETSEGRDLQFTVLRGPEQIEMSLAPRPTERLDPETNTISFPLMLGVSASFNLGIEPPRESVGPIEAVGLGAGSLWRVVSSTFSYLGSWASGAADGSAIGGPLGIARASGYSAEAGFLTFIGFIATVSTAIGLINLFPIPILDGGHLVFYGIEAVRGKPLSERWVELGMKVGLGLILVLLVFATYNDVARILTGWEPSC